MTPERAKMLEAVAEAVGAMISAPMPAGNYKVGSGGGLVPFRELALLVEAKIALDALSSLPAEPADAGEMVEVRACVALQPDGRWNWIGFGNALGPANDETLAEYALDFGAGNAKVAAFTTARIPRPVVPEVRAEVET